MDDGIVCVVVEVCYVGKFWCVLFYLVVICIESKC